MTIQQANEMNIVDYLMIIQKISTTQASIRFA